MHKEARWCSYFSSYKSFCGSLLQHHASSVRSQIRGLEVTFLLSCGFLIIEAEIGPLTKSDATVIISMDKSPTVEFPKRQLFTCRAKPDPVQWAFLQISLSSHTKLHSQDINLIMMTVDCLLKTDLSLKFAALLDLQKCEKILVIYYLTLLHGCWICGC